MNRLAFIAIVTVLVLSLSAVAGVERIDISPTTMYNFAEGHAGAFMGGAVAADVFISRWAALRTTLGFTKDRYFPSEMDYADADYGFWFSFAPYVQAPVDNAFTPYLSLLGTVSGSSGRSVTGRPVAGNELAPVRNVATASDSQSLVSLGASLGTKFHLGGPVSLFGEVTHYFYSNVFGAEDTYPGSTALFGRPLDFERNPTYSSFGLTYRLNLSRK